MAARFLTADEERALIVQAQAGDIEARNRVIANIMPMLWREAYKIVNRADHFVEAEDLVQEALLMILNRFHLFNPKLGYRFTTYFGRPAIGVMQSASKQNGVVNTKNANPKCKPETMDLRWKHFGPLVSLSETHPDPTGESPTWCMLDMLLDHREYNDGARLELVAAVRECVRRISPSYRRVILAKMTGKTFREIGREYGVTTQRIQQIMTAAKKKLAPVLLAHPVVREHLGSVDSVTKTN